MKLPYLKISLLLMVLMFVTYSTSYKKGFRDGFEEGTDDMYNIVMDTIQYALDRQLKSDTSFTKLVLINPDSTTYYISRETILSTRDTVNFTKKDVNDFDKEDSFTNTGGGQQNINKGGNQVIINN